MLQLHIHSFQYEKGRKERKERPAPPEKKNTTEYLAKIKELNTNLPHRTLISKYVVVVVSI